MAVRGTVTVPGDKSISHRALLLAARAEGTSTLRGLSPGQDVTRTRGAVEAMGAEVEGQRVTGGVGRLHEPQGVLDVGNSGTSIRLLAGFCAPLPWLTVLQGDDSVANRPMDRVTVPLRTMGALVDGRQGGRLPPLVVRGASLTGIDFTPPVASAQVKSCVLLAGLGAKGETVVREPVATRAHTEELLAACGADIRVQRVGSARVVRLRESSLTPFEIDVPGDPSQAAFWVVAACITPGSEMVIEDVYLGPGRTGFIDVLQRMGADLEVEVTGESTAGRRGRIRARHRPLSATEVGGHEVPGLIDEIPVLAVAAAVANGVTTFRDASELRVKESDRVTTMASELGAMGARVEPLQDGFVVAGSGGAPLQGATVCSHGDHRVAMALAVAALVADGATRVEGWDAVASSYPGFAEELQACVS
ncbi:MAG: 3-phosphoshikimate 1-carboxyvinyltransferase [Actinobacteria bacterium]|nr:MAG: 3-phosphoshikimate 1-carboxyvinyltransferase [Actinomycetota bacterium]